MSSFRVLSFAATILLMAAAGDPTSAQTGDDWSITDDPAQQAVGAATTYSNGVTLNAQCVAGTLVVGLSGLPSGREGARKLNWDRADGRLRQTHWQAAAGGSLMISPRDARLVRALKQERMLSLRSPSDEEQPFRLDLELPSQSTGIDRVLTACGWPLTDARDELDAVDDLLTKGPRVELASPDSTASVMQVYLSCIISQSRLTQCQSDWSSSSSPRMGEATARRANGVPVVVTDQEAAEGRLIDVVITGERRVSVRSGS